MSLRINFNAAAVGAHRTLTGTDNALGKSIERLSSGFRINNAGDNPAGLVISENLRAQVSGLAQAVQNASDAVNMVKTAEGALAEAHSLLRSMRDLAVHAANTGAIDAAAAAADQQQITSAIASINNIASETKFGNKTLLDGSAGIKATPTGDKTYAANLSNWTDAVDTTLYINVTVKAEKAQDTGTVDISGDMTANSITINGVTVSGGLTGAATVANVNNVTDQTGVVGSLSGTNLVLTQVNYGSSERIDITGGADIWGSATDAAIGVDVAGEVTTDAGFTLDITDATWQSGNGTVLEDAVGNTISLTEAGAGTADDWGSQLQVEVGTLTFQVGAFANQTRTLNINSVAASGLGNGVSGGTTSVADIDVTSGVGATEAIQVLDAAITDVSNLRSSLGATQKNTLESCINSLTVAKENIAASESTIRDTDMAAEILEFTRNQIMQQAGVAMLSQATQAPQALLALLR